MAAARETYDNRDRLSTKRSPGARSVRSRPPTVYYTYDRHGERVELTAREMECRTAEAQLALPIGDATRG